MRIYNILENISGNITLVKLLYDTLTLEHTQDIHLHAMLKFRVYNRILDLNPIADSI